jgi:hypothetical protein
MEAKTTEKKDEISKPEIYIIKSLKELSEWGNGLSMKCGNGFTNENCVGDFVKEEEKYIINKRQNYSDCIGDKCAPNKFLSTTDIDVNLNTSLNNEDNKSNQFVIDDFKNNWTKLFANINKILTNPSKVAAGGGQESNTPTGEQELPNVFICGHQHSFQNLFFKFDKITSDKVKEIENPQSKEKIEKEVELHTQAELLEKPILENINVPKYKKFLSDKEYKKFLSDKIKCKDRLKKEFYNSCLTLKGLTQAQELNKFFNDNGLNYKEGDILISSPLDRALQTLAEAVFDPVNGIKFKNKFIEMYNFRFERVAHDDIIPLHEKVQQTPTDSPAKTAGGSQKEVLKDETEKKSNWNILQNRVPFSKTLLQNGALFSQKKLQSESPFSQTLGLRNASCIKVSEYTDRNGKLIIETIFSKRETNEKKKYYYGPDIPTDFKTLELNNFLKLCPTTKASMFSGDFNVEAFPKVKAIYFIRHGEALHNFCKSSWESDPVVTNNPNATAAGGKNKRMTKNKRKYINKTLSGNILKLLKSQKYKKLSVKKVSNKNKRIKIKE